MWINFTEDEVNRLRALLHDLSIVGGNGIVVSRQDYAKFSITDERPVRKPVQNGGGAGAFFPIRVQLDSTTATLTGTRTTQCQFKYYAFPFDEQTYEDEHRLEQVSRLDFRPRTATGRYIPAPDGSVGMGWYDGTQVRIIAWREVAFSEFCG